MPAHTPETQDVVLAFPHPGQVTTDFMLSVLAVTHAADTRIAAVTDLRTGPFLAQARTEIGRRFLASGLPWLWMVDSDMTFTENTLPALLDWADPATTPLVGALCRTLAGGQTIVTAYRADKDPDGRFGFTSLHGGELPADTLIRVDATGCACLLAHRSVFERIDAHEGTPALWFCEQTIDGRPFGEDMSFSLRCAAAGVPLHIHTGIRAGHLRAVQIGEAIP
jgi:hypothetical protein